MVITLKPSVTQNDIDEVLELLRSEGLDGRLIRGAELSTINVIGDESKRLDFLHSLVNLPYVSAFTPISSPYKVISRDAHPDYNGQRINGQLLSKEIRAGSLVIGGNNPLAIIPGPCSIDIKEPSLMDEMAAFSKESGAKGLRGGAYKPRTEPYTFRGYGEPALELGRRMADKYGLAFVTEPVEVEHIDKVIQYAHVLQIGTRNANQSFHLAVARKTLENQMPILAKRGMAQYLEREFLPLVLNIYDYEPGRGNTNIMLCLRGIRTFNDTTRFTLDAGDVPVLKEKCILPVVGDPSHAAGLEKYVVPFAKAFIGAGVDALLVEIYPPGKKPLSDAMQAISYKQLEEIVQYAKQIGRM